MNGPKYPDVEVELVGNDGNAFAIMGNVRQAMRREGIEESEFTKYREEAMSGDYDNLLQVTMQWVTVS